MKKLIFQIMTTTSALFRHYGNGPVLQLDKTNEKLSVTHDLVTVRDKWSFLL